MSAGKVAVDLGFATVECTIRRGRGARVWLRWSPDRGLVVSLPHRAPLAAAVETLTRHRRWVRARLEALAAAAEEARTAPRELLFRGRPVEVTVAASDVGRAGVDASDGRLVVSRGTRVAAPAAVLERWLRAQALGDVESRVAERAAAMGVAPQRIAIRGQRSRWGSCSSRGTLTFNWRLVLAPPECLDYVVVHELGHLQAPRHDARFWGLVAAHCPGFRAHRRWLRDHQQALMRPLVAFCHL